MATLHTLIRPATSALRPSTLLRPTHSLLRPTQRTIHTTTASTSFQKPTRFPTRTLGLTLGASTFLYSQSLLPRARCDSPAFSTSTAQYERSAQTPVTKNGRLNAKAVRQISAGSIVGLLGGLAVATFSKSLAVVIGLLVFGLQTLESRGIHVIPYGRLQRGFTNTNIVSLVQDNVAFKLCFGATFALAAFAEF